MNKNHNVSDPMHLPLVSIIVPSFNYGHYIHNTLITLQYQQYRNWEAIVVDDGSCDNTRAVVEEFTKTDSRFRYFYKENGGLADARNYGLKRAQGQYIQFLDADDLLSSNKLSHQVSYMEMNWDCQISYTSAKYFLSEYPEILYNTYDLRHEEWIRKVPKSGISLLKLFISENLFPVNSALLRRDEILTNNIVFNTEMKYLEDWEFWVSCVLKGFKFQYVPNKEAYALIRVHQTSMSKNRLQMYIHEEKLFKQLHRTIFNSKIADRSLILVLIEHKFLKINQKILAQKGMCNFIAIRESISNLGFCKFLKIYLKELNNQRKKFINDTVKKMRSKDSI